VVKPRAKDAKSPRMSLRCCVLRETSKQFFLTSHHPSKPNLEDSIMVNNSATVGVVDGKLRSCPDTPNCVSSMESRPPRFVEPIALQRQPRCRAISAQSRAGQSKADANRKRRRRLPARGVPELDLSLRQRPGVLPGPPGKENPCSLRLAHRHLRLGRQPPLRGDNPPGIQSAGVIRFGKLKNQETKFQDEDQELLLEFVSWFLEFSSEAAAERSASAKA